MSGNTFTNRTQWKYSHTWSSFCIVLPLILLSVLKDARINTKVCEDWTCWRLVQLVQADPSKHTALREEKTVLRFQLKSVTMGLLSSTYSGAFHLVGFVLSLFHKSSALWKLTGLKILLKLCRKTKTRREGIRGDKSILAFLRAYFWTTGCKNSSAQAGWSYHLSIKRCVRTRLVGFQNNSSNFSPSILSLKFHLFKGSSTSAEIHSC